MLRKCSPKFSSRISVSLIFTFRCMCIYLVNSLHKMLNAHGDRHTFRFSVWFVEKVVFSTDLSLYLCQKPTGHTCVVYFWMLLYFIDPFFNLLALMTLLYDYQRFTKSLNIMWFESTAFILTFSLIIHPVSNLLVGVLLWSAEGGTSMARHMLYLWALCPTMSPIPLHDEVFLAPNDVCFVLGTLRWLTAK